MNYKRVSEKLTLKTAASRRGIAKYILVLSKYSDTPVFLHEVECEDIRVEDIPRLIESMKNRKFLECLRHDNKKWTYQIAHKGADFIAGVIDEQQEYIVQMARWKAMDKYEYV